MAIQNPLKIAANKALVDFSKDTATDYTFGGNFSNISTQFETFVNNYLFPKITETVIIEQALGNTFNFLAKEVPFIGQMSEEYVVMDTVPIAMDLTQDETLALKRNYPKIASKIYGQGILKKVKFTLNNNDTRLNFSTIGDAVSYALGVYKKKISDINVAEEREIKAMLVDYAINVAKDKRKVTSKEELIEQISKSVLDLQNNSEMHNEANTASGGSVGRYTTVSKLSDILIITTNEVQTYLLNSFIGNTFNIKGLDLSSQIISFDTLGGVFKANKDITLNQTQVDYLKAFGDYQSKVGTVIYKGTIFTFDVSQIFNKDVDEIKPSSDNFAIIIDKNAIRYKRYTQGMLKEPMNNSEFDEVNHWIHYYSFKAVSPFYNKIVIE